MKQPLINFRKDVVERILKAEFSQVPCPLVIQSNTDLTTAMKGLCRRWNLGY